MNKRQAILDANQSCRNGTAPVRRLEEGYVALRIPEADYRILCRLYPELNHQDPQIRLAAWKQLEAGEVGDKYRVTRHSPRQLKRIAQHGNKGIIVK